jgi:hypothetical protein
MTKVEYWYSAQKVIPTRSPMLESLPESSSVSQVTLEQR